MTRYLDGSIASISGTAVTQENYSYQYDTTSGYLTTTRTLGDSGRITPPLHEHLTGSCRAHGWRDKPGPAVTTDTVTTVSSYASGTRRLASRTSAAGMSIARTMLFTKPNANSSLSRNGYNVDSSGGGLSPTSNDRITEAASGYLSENNYIWEVSTRKSYDGAGGSALTTTSKRCLNGNPGGFASWTKDISPSGEAVDVKTSINFQAKTLTRTETTGTWDPTTNLIVPITANPAVSVYVNSLLVSRTGRD